jgi:hypothetical protein
MSDFQKIVGTGKKDIRFTTDPNLAMGAAEGEISNCEIRIQGDAYNRGDEVPRGVHKIPLLPPIGLIPEKSSGRLQLAAWIASSDNPLTARVMVNRVWQHLFGRGLVRTVDDFGSTGEAPTHPELLDHLAARFVAEGWSVKKLIRTIVLSRTYRQSSAGQRVAGEKDPSNQLYWRVDPKRLEVEVIRDNLVNAGGFLIFDRPDGIQVTGIGGKGRVGQVRSLIPIDSSYRTVYHPVLRAFIPELLDTFDFCDPCQLNGQRQVTTVATQALFFMNGPMVAECAQDAAEKLLEAKGFDNEERVRQAYLKILSRPPTDDEIDAALSLVKELQPPANTRNAELYRWTTFIQALFATAEFRYAL